MRCAVRDVRPSLDKERLVWKVVVDHILLQRRGFFRNNGLVEALVMTDCDDMLELSLLFPSPQDLNTIGQGLYGQRDGDAAPGSTYTGGVLHPGATGMLMRLLRHWQAVTGDASGTLYAYGLKSIYA